MKKIILVPLAMLLAACGSLAGVTPAKAAEPPQFPSCVKAQLSISDVKYYFDPGNLADVKIRKVTVEGVDLTRRRDGIWVGVAPKVEDDKRPYAYFTYNHSKNQGAWAKCGKIKPPVIR